MSKRWLILLVVATLLMSATPALAHTVSYTYRETGTLECNFDENVRTDIYAYGHHRHTRVGFTHVIFHTGTDQEYHTGVTWNYSAMEWATSNQTGYDYNFLRSGASCVG